MTSHTAGPWIARKIYGGNGEPLGWQIEAGQILIAWPSVVDCGEAEGAANAYLLAAAPDLLEALKRLVRTHTTGVHYSGDHPVALANAAIAKAEGGK